MVSENNKNHSKAEKPLNQSLNFEKTDIMIRNREQFQARKGIPHMKTGLGYQSFKGVKTRQISSGNGGLLTHDQ